MQGGLRFAYKKKKEAAKEKQNFKKFILDEVAYPVGFFAALVNLPQLIQIWSSKSAGELSLFSWAGFTLASAFWFYYALVHREKALVFTFGFTIILQAFIVLGILIYR